MEDCLTLSDAGFFILNVLSLMSYGLGYKLIDWYRRYIVNSVYLNAVSDHRPLINFSFLNNPCLQLIQAVKTTATHISFAAEFSLTCCTHVKCSTVISPANYMLSLPLDGTQPSAVKLRSFMSTTAGCLSSLIFLSF